MVKEISDLTLIVLAGGYKTMNEYIQSFSASQVAQQIGVKAVTLRTWCKALEDSGYNIIRDEHNNRVFTERDISALRMFQDCMTKSLGWEAATTLVIKEFGAELPPIANSNNVRDETQTTLLSALNEMHEMMADMAEEMRQQREFNQELVKRLDQQSMYIEETIKRRDEQLMQTLRQMQENTRLQLAAAQEKKKSWWRFGK